MRLLLNPSRLVTIFPSLSLRMYFVPWTNHMSMFNLWPGSGSLVVLFDVPLSIPTGGLSFVGRLCVNLVASACVMALLVVY
jgi:hypothetical protein